MLVLLYTVREGKCLWCQKRFGEVSNTRRMSIAVFAEPAVSVKLRSLGIFILTMAASCRALSLY